MAGRCKMSVVMHGLVLATAVILDEPALARELPAEPAANVARQERGSPGPVGMFEGHADVGEVRHEGSTTFDAAARSYTVSGGGENMWFAKDAFHFAWKQAVGDVALSADVAFLGQGKEAHRKACLMIRQSLDAGSAYVDVALHGDGLTSLQFRDEQGATTHEVQASVRRPAIADREAWQVQRDVPGA